MKELLMASANYGVLICLIFTILGHLSWWIYIPLHICLIFLNIRYEKEEGESPERTHFDYKCYPYKELED